MPGRPRKPTAVKARQGTLQPCRTNPAEPQLSPSLPPPPDGLPPRVVEAYYAHGQRLLDMEVVTAADAGALLGCAQAYVDWREAVEMLDRYGSQIVEEPILTKDGDVIGYKIRKHPAVDVRNNADKRYQNWCTKFGLTPADRSRVNAVTKEQKSPMAKLLEMRRA